MIASGRGERGRSLNFVNACAVGLCGVIAARRLGAEQIIIRGLHADLMQAAARTGQTAA
jgi:threonine dehydrogenase-like Zn-dependent dehydrogenase